MEELIQKALSSSNKVSNNSLIEKIIPVGGGCIHKAWSIHFQNGKRVFAKSNHIDNINMFDDTAVIGSALTSTTVASTSATTIASHAAATYRTVKYLVQCTQGTDYHSTEINLIHDGTTVYITEYGTLFDNASLGTFNASISAFKLFTNLVVLSSLTTALFLIFFARDA